MENNSEIYKLITASIDSLRQDFYRRADSTDAKIESLRPCIVTRQSCNERHAEINRRMVDKMLFVGASGMLFLVIALVGVILMLR